MSINTIRLLSVDVVHKANGSHPGLPLVAAPMAYVCGPDFFNTTQPIRTGSIGTDLSCQPATGRCSCIVYCISRAMICGSNNSHGFANGAASRRVIPSEGYPPT